MSPVSRSTRWRSSLLGRGRSRPSKEGRPQCRHVLALSSDLVVLFLVLRAGQTHRLPRHTQHHATAAAHETLPSTFSPVHAPPAQWSVCPPITATKDQATDLKATTATADRLLEALHAAFTWPRAPTLTRPQQAAWQLLGCWGAAALATGLRRERGGAGGKRCWPRPRQVGLICIYADWLAQVFHYSQ